MTCKTQKSVRFPHADNHVIDKGLFVSLKHEGSFYMSRGTAPELISTIQVQTMACFVSEQGPM